MIVSSHPLAVLDHYRIPYTLEPETGSASSGRLSRRGGTAELLWATRSAEPAGLYSFLGVPFVGALASPQTLEELRAGRTWETGAEVCTHEGVRLGHVLHASDGSVLLPFDPDEIVWGTLSETYAPLLQPRGAAAARNAYYVLRGLVPRTVQIAARRRYTRIQARASFPSWPAETRFHGVLSWLAAQIESVAGEPVPWIAAWPAGRTSSLVLTHDVERRAGYQSLDPVVEIERAAGVRSAWYFVPERDYQVTDERVAELAADGFEVGVHGLRHDGRDLDPRVFPERVRAIRRYAERWGAVGFRSPSTLREWSAMPKLGFEYDSSYSDVAPYEPLSGGSCTWLPFFIGDTVELPITMPMDHTIFDLLNERDGSQWSAKAELLRRRGGMVLLLTHPDYLPGRLHHYERFLAEATADESVWKALPREVGTWWRERAATRVVPGAAGWSVEGPGADRARVIVGLRAGA